MGILSSYIGSFDVYNLRLDMYLFTVKPLSLSRDDMAAMAQLSHLVSMFWYGKRPKILKM